MTFLQICEIPKSKLSKIPVLQICEILISVLSNKIIQVSCLVELAMGRVQNRSKKSICHDQARCIVCILCMKKHSVTRIVTAQIQDQIKRHHSPNIDFQNDLLPSHICNGCRNKLSALEKGCKPQGALPCVYDYSTIVPVHQTRSISAGEHSCTICQIAKENKTNQKKKKKNS